MVSNWSSEGADSSRRMHISHHDSSTARESVDGGEKGRGGSRMVRVLAEFVVGSFSDLSMGWFNAITLGPLNAITLESSNAITLESPIANSINCCSHKSYTINQTTHRHLHETVSFAPALRANDLQDPKTLRDISLASQQLTPEKADRNHSVRLPIAPTL